MPTTLSQHIAWDRAYGIDAFMADDGKLTAPVVARSPAAFEK